jgi:hypothetical protein
MYCCAAAGKGAVYTYDAIGSYERTGYSCQGSGKDLMQPVLDNQLKAASPLLVPPRVSPCVHTYLISAVWCVFVVNGVCIMISQRTFWHLCSGLSPEWG